jgi:ribonuclease VapC
LLTEDRSRLPVSCYLETCINLRRRGFAPRGVDDYLEYAAVQLLPSDERQAHIAAEADRRFGRGTGHPARLNFGDCLAYAAAVAHDAPLLFKGGDFARTDVRRAA